MSVKWVPMLQIRYRYVVYRLQILFPSLRWFPDIVLARVSRCFRSSSMDGLLKGRHCVPECGVTGNGVIYDVAVHADITTTQVFAGRQHFACSAADNEGAG